MPRQVHVSNILKQRYVRGERYTVVRDGGYLRGLWPAGPGMEALWRKDLRIGDVITCASSAFTAGDGVPIIRWRDADGEAACE